MSFAKRLEKALLNTGTVSSIWSCVGTQDEATALCRANGATRQEKERTMEALARLVAPAGVFVAKQFICKEGAFGYTWNVSVFDEEHLRILEEVHLAPPTPPPARKEPTEDDGWRVGQNEEGEDYYFRDFALPHAPGGDRNAPSDGRGDGLHPAPLGHGRGASRTKRNSRRR